MFSTELVGRKRSLCRRRMDDAGLLDAELDSTALRALSAGDVMVTGADLGFGIKPRGPSTLPSRPTRGISRASQCKRSKNPICRC